MNDLSNSTNAAGSTPLPDPPDPVAGASVAGNRPSDDAENNAYRVVDPEPPPAVEQGPSAPGVDEQTREVASVEQPTTFQRSEETASRPAGPTFPDSLPRVTDVWARWVDWKDPLLWTSAGVGLATLIVFAGPYVAIASFVAGITYGSYRLVTSLEVPVRVTPEQAIEEFYSAFSHRLPNFHRMYGLLTDDAKRCESFRSFAEFCSYWKGQIGEISRSPVWLVPLEFHIEGFNCRYDEQKTMAVVRYLVKITPRGRAEFVKPFAELEVKKLLVKGRDGQWYLHDGTL